MELFGHKIKRYVVLQCSHCNESFEVDAMDLNKAMQENENTFVSTVCPWCEETHIVHVPSLNDFRMGYANRIARVE